MAGRPLVAVDGHGVLELFAEDNLTGDQEDTRAAEYAVKPTDKKKFAAVKRLSSAPVWPKNFRARPAATVKADVLKNAGARPWDRDEVDQRIVRQVVEGRGRIIDSQEQVGGYPHPVMTERKLNVPAEGVETWLAGFIPSEK